MVGFVLDCVFGQGMGVSVLFCWGEGWGGKAIGGGKGEKGGGVMIGKRG